MSSAAQTSLIHSSGSTVTMSSREIASLTEKRHDNVMRDIRSMLSELGEDALKFEGIYHDAVNREQIEYLLNRDLTDCLLTGYSAVARMRVIKRWRELETQVAKPAELSRMDILKLAMESEEARVKAEAERDDAIRTKALIGSRREASAMATAANAKRQVEALKQKLGEAQRWASVKAVERATGRTLAWKPLRDWCNANEVEIKKVFDANYGSVNSYPLQAWRDVYQIDLSGLFAETV